MARTQAPARHCWRDLGCDPGRLGGPDDGEPLRSAPGCDQFGDIGERTNGANDIRRDDEFLEAGAIDARCRLMRGFERQPAVTTPDIGRMPGRDDERPWRSLKERAAAAKPVHDGFGIAGNDPNRRVGRHGRNPGNHQFRRCHGESQGHRIIETGIAVEEQANLFHRPS